MALTSRSAPALQTFERTARVWMGGVAVVAAMVGIGFNAGLISTVPVYDRQSWYLVSEHAGFIVTSRVDDEEACRKREKSDAICRSGSSLADQRPIELARQP